MPENPLIPDDTPAPLWKRVLLPFWYVGMVPVLIFKTWWRNTRGE